MPVSSKISETTKSSASWNSKLASSTPKTRYSQPSPRISPPAHPELVVGSPRPAHPELVEGSPRASRSASGLDRFFHGRGNGGQHFVQHVVRRAAAQPRLRTRDQAMRQH